MSLSAIWITIYYYYVGFLTFKKMLYTIVLLQEK